MFNTTITRTTRYGYSNTITLAEAMANREHNRLDSMCRNLAANFASLPMAIGIVAQVKARRTR